MTKIPSVEERVEEIVNKIAKGTDSDRTFGTGETLNPLSKRIITQALTAERTALLTELREYTANLKGVYSAHDVQEAIKAHIDELINPTSV